MDILSGVLLQFILNLKLKRSRLNWAFFFTVKQLKQQGRITQNINNHFYHGIGITGNIGKRKHKIIHTLPSPTIFQKETIINSDTDGDGINNTTDACPLQPGLSKFEGCPDSDGDGIQDKDDKCPNTLGLIRLHGCLIADSDNDGIE